MAYAWFICPYLRDTSHPGEVLRYCAMNMHNAIIFGDGGDWAETEVLGDVALVKVRASDATLSTIAGATDFVRVLNRWTLTDVLTNLTTAQRNAIQNKLLSMGYTQAEINAAMGTNLAAWRTHTLADLLHLVATRRLKPRYDRANDLIVLDGDVVTPTAVELVAARVA